MKYKVKKATILGVDEIEVKTELEAQKLIKAGIIEGKASDKMQTK